MSIWNMILKKDDEILKIPFKAGLLKTVKEKYNVVGVVGSRWLASNNYVVDFSTNTIYKK